MFTAFPIKPPRAARPGQRRAHAEPAGGLPGVTAPTLVIGFADDVVVPAYLGAEVADAIPERPVPPRSPTPATSASSKPDAVNTAILEFFADTRV